MDILDTLICLLISSVVIIFLILLIRFILDGHRKQFMRDQEKLWKIASGEINISELSLYRLLVKLAPKLLLIFILVWILSMGITRSPVLSPIQAQINKQQLALRTSTYEDCVEPLSLCIYKLREHLTELVQENLSSDRCSEINHYTQSICRWLIIHTQYAQNNTSGNKKELLIKMRELLNHLLDNDKNTQIDQHSVKCFLLEVIQILDKIRQEAEDF